MKAERPLLVLKYQVNPEHEVAFEAWYQAYMKRFMARVPEIACGRRVVTETNGVKHYMSMYEVVSMDKVEAMFASIGQDTPERIKDSDEWHHWENVALSSLTDGIYTTLQYEENGCGCGC